jgi:hypothetical protein
MKQVWIPVLFLSLFMTTHSSAQSKPADELLSRIFAEHKAEFDSVLRHKDDLNVQVLFSEIMRDKKGNVSFVDHSFNLDDQRYYYPASTVKLPIALLALQRLNELNIPGLDMNTTMITGSAGGAQTEVLNDPSTVDGRPCIAQYIRKILLVSDNDAFNRLYEFLGQEYINEHLHLMGYKDMEIIHRLDISLSEEENRRTNPVYFYDKEGRLVYTKPATTSNYIYSKRTAFIGNGYMRGGQLVNEPMDFSKKNRFPLSALHSIVKSVIFPDAVPKQQQFLLTSKDLEFVHQYMSMMPYQSPSPVYDSSQYWDTYVKFLFYGAEKNAALPNIRIYNKPGDAYGFLIDGAYITDSKRKLEFILSAVIYCNSDGILNDDHYDYGTLGLPFMKNLGRAVYEYELKKMAH